MKLTRVWVPALLAASVAFGANAQPTPQAPALRQLSLDDAVPDAHGIKRMALLRGLDKTTGRAIDITAPAGVPVRFGTLSITVRYCYTRPPVEPPETTAFLQIDEFRPDQNPLRIFSGWMFASSPALNALEHPIYDVWIIGCNTTAPDTDPPPNAVPPPPDNKLLLKPPSGVAPEPQPPPALNSEPQP